MKRYRELRRIVCLPVIFDPVRYKFIVEPDVPFQTARYRIRCDGERKRTLELVVNGIKIAVLISAALPPMGMRTAQRFACGHAHRQAVRSRSKRSVKGCEIIFYGDFPHRIGDDRTVFRLDFVIFLGGVRFVVFENHRKLSYGRNVPDLRISINDRIAVLGTEARNGVPLAVIPARERRIGNLSAVLVTDIVIHRNDTPFLRQNKALRASRERHAVRRRYRDRGYDFVYFARCARRARSRVGNIQGRDSIAQAQILQLSAVRQTEFLVDLQDDRRARIARNGIFQRNILARDRIDVGIEKLFAAIDEQNLLFRRFKFEIFCAQCHRQSIHYDVARPALG